LIGHAELGKDPRFAANSDRLANREALAGLLSEVFLTRDAEDWLEVLSQAGLPCGSINTIPEALENPQAQARDLVLVAQHPSAGSLRLTGFPYKLSQTPAQLRRPPPLLGEHTTEVLVDLLGYSPEEVALLREQGAI
jgi:crotonobetainyl-CoA:carnitine CoA-transferase CaiB-like acyl-CoA transferase